MNSGNYFCDILDFNTDIWLRWRDGNIKKLRGMPENVYSVVLYPTAGKKAKKVLKVSEDFFTFYTETNVFVSKSYSFIMCYYVYNEKNVKYIMEGFKHFKDYKFIWKCL